jgi:large subunit ribosomal protein L25
LKEYFLMADMRLTAQARTLTGRKVRQLRRQGLVPVVVYGQGVEPETLQVEAMAMERMLQRGGSAQLVEVEIEGQSDPRHVLIREIQRHPLRHDLLHADFYSVSMTEKQRVSVPIVRVGHPDIESAELMLLQTLDHVEIEALPADIPAHVEVDVSNLGELADVITVAELPVIPGIEYLTAAEETVFSMVATRAAAEEEEELEELEEEPAEPEVIGRGREEEEEEES